MSKFRFEVVCKYDFSLTDILGPKKTERDRLKTRLNALGLEGYRFIFFDEREGLIWLQKET